MNQTPTTTRKSCEASSSLPTPTWTTQNSTPFSTDEPDGMDDESTSTAFPSPSRAWRSDALCLEYDGELWFTDDWGAPDLVKQAKAKAICSKCLVQSECLADALLFEGKRPVRFRSTIRGGLTPEERFELS